MQKIKLVNLLFIVMALLCFASCEYDTIEFEEVVIPPEQEISFNADIQPIFTSNCITCHNATRNPDLRESNSYNSLISGGFINTDNPTESVLYQQLQSGEHATRATQTQKETILEWITRGAKNN